MSARLAAVLFVVAMLAIAAALAVVTIASPSYTQVGGTPPVGAPAVGGP